MDAGVGDTLGAVKLTEYTAPDPPQFVCPFTVNEPEVKPLLNCKVILELSSFASMIEVLAGLVHLYTSAAMRVDVEAPGVTV
jgi:hypothetical protein